MIIIKTTAKDLNYINRFAAKEQTRYNLRGIRVDPEQRRLIATDGCRLGMLSNAWDKDYTLPSGAPELTAGVTLETKADKNIISVMKKLDGTVTIEIPEDALAPTRNVNLTAKIYDNNGLSVTVGILDSSYPDYMRVFPSERTEETTAIAFNPAYMNDFAGYDKGDKIRMEFFGPLAPMMVKNSSLPDFVGLLMPYRWDASDERRD